MGLNASFEILPAMSLPYKNTLPISSGAPVELIVVLQASVFLYGNVALRQCATFIRCQK